MGQMCVKHSAWCLEHRKHLKEWLLLLLWLNFYALNKIVLVFIKRQKIIINYMARGHLSSCSLYPYTHTQGNELQMSSLQHNPSLMRQCSGELLHYITRTVSISVL